MTKIEYIAAGIMGAIAGTFMALGLMDVDFITWLNEAFAYYN